MSKSKDENNTKATSNPLIFKHVDSLERINHNTSKEKEDSPPPPFPHVDSMVLLGAITIIGVEGPIDEDIAGSTIKENSDSTS